MITPINSNIPNTNIDLNSIERQVKFKPSFSLDSNNDKFNFNAIRINKNEEESTLITQENVENSIEKIDHTLDKLEEPLEEIDSNLEEMKEKIRKVMDLTSETLQHSYQQQPTTSTFHNNHDDEEEEEEQQNTEDEYESSSSFQYLNERDLVEDNLTRPKQTNQYSNTGNKRSVSPPQRKDVNIEKILENDFSKEKVSPRRRKKELIENDILQEEIDELIESPDETPKPKDTRKYVTKEENEPKKYYRIATMSTGFLFLINSFMLYFGGEGKLNMDNLYGYGSGSSHLQRTAAILFLVMGIVNLAPNIFGGEDGFSLERAAEYFPFVVALLNVIVSAHYIFENIRASATFNWVAFAGLIVFIVLNVQLASLSHPGTIVLRKKNK